MPIKAILIAGPTASGKSGGRASSLPTGSAAPIINADSMQVYRELRLLTARPSRGRMRRARPIASTARSPPPEAYSVGRWLEDVARAMAEAQGEGRLPILVGGTGLYFKALTEGLAPVPTFPPRCRAHWRERAAQLGGEGLLPRACRARPGHGGAARARRSAAHRPRPRGDRRHRRLASAEWQGASAAPAARARASAEARDRARSASRFMPRSTRASTR